MYKIKAGTAFLIYASMLRSSVKCRMHEEVLFCHVTSGLGQGTSGPTRTKAADASVSAVLHTMILAKIIYIYFDSGEPILLQFAYERQIYL